MLRHLKYIDNTSDKFWQIETKGNSHTVTYGRNGTDGQSKTKDFDNEAACIKDAEKLIAEKIKKGYSEDGLGIKKETPVKIATGEKSDKQVIVTEFAHLIESGQVANLIPFLDKYLKGNTELIKGEIKKAKRYWLTYTDLSKDAQYSGRNNSRWGTRGNERHKKMIELSALATFSLSDTASWSELIEYINRPKDKDVAQLLDWAKPDWLADFTAAQFAKNEWVSIDYAHLRMQEERGHFTFNPEVYARSIADYNDWRAGAQNGMRGRINYIINDPVAYQRDVPLLFQYETSIQNNYLVYDYKNKDGNQLLWDEVFDLLLQEGKMEKSFLIENCLACQTKDWNNNLKSFFRKTIVRLQLEEEALVEFQESFFALLHAENSAVVNFAIDHLKTILHLEAFKMEEFLNWVAPVMMRSDLKNGIKTLLIQLDKVAKNNPKYLAELTQLFADVFMVPDLELQERATKFLEKYGDKNNEDLSEKLNLYTGQMLGNCKDSLLPFLDEASQYTETLLSNAISEPNIYQPAITQRLNPENEINYPDSWNDILFQVGQSIGAATTLDMEILMYSFTMQRHLFPDNYKEELAPYIKQLKTKYLESSTYNLFSEVFISIYYEEHKIFKPSERYYREMKHLEIWKKQLTHFQTLLFSKATLPRLCTPTHSPYWVHPATLVRRILTYEEANVAIDETDLIVAINRMPREQTEEAIGLLAGIKNEFIQNLMRFALGQSNEIQVKNKTWWQSLLSNATNDHEPALWASVARTFHPEDTFEIFESSLKQVPFAIKPLRPTFEVKPFYHNVRNYVTKKDEPHFLGNRLSIDFPEFQKVPETFIYGFDLFRPAQKERPYFYYFFSVMDAAYCFSLTPQNPEPLALAATYIFCNDANNTSKGVDGLLQEMLTTSVTMTYGLNIFLAANLFGKSKTSRALAGEVLIHYISENSLPAEALGTIIGQLISYEYGPINRLAEVLVTLKDISPAHNDALWQLAESILLHSQLKEKMPANFKKILELYFDLSIKLNNKASDSMQATLDHFEKYAALKPIITKLKNL